MSALRVTGFLVVLGYLFIGVHSQLYCPCTGLCSAGNLTKCLTDEVCFTAEILDESTNNIQVKKGCKKRSECGDASHCPESGPDDVCYRFGCCHTNSCVVTNWTVSPDVASSTPTPSPTPSAIAIVSPSSSPTSSSIQEPAPKSSSPLVLAATSSPVTMAIKQPVSMTTEQPMVKMTSQPVAAKSKIPTNEPMTSAADAMSTKQEVKPTASKEMVTSSEVSKIPTNEPMTSAADAMSTGQEVKPTASKEMMTSSEVKMEPKGTPTDVPVVHSLKLVEKDTRPTCSSNCLFSCNVFFLIAVATLCVLF